MCSLGVHQQGEICSETEQMSPIVVHGIVAVGGRPDWSLGLQIT